MTTTDPQVITRRGGAGTGAFGLYIDLIVYSEASGQLIRQERYFLVDNLLCKYMRRYGNKRAAWKAFPLTTHSDARSVLERNINRLKTLGGYGVEMVCKPLLVELTSVDVAAIKKNIPPAARHEGSRVAEKLAGKIDDATFKPKAVAAKVAEAEAPF